jgi:hydrogenase nickel incorporation protein HypB
MTSQSVPVVEKIFSANDQIAAENRKMLDEAGIFAINMMASPGSGKTSVILQTIKALANDLKIAIIEGDTAPVTIDADKVNAQGIPAIQINTDGACHLDALMLKHGLEALDLSDLDLIIVENVGNLVCPASFNLGTHASMVVASIPEGDDKPYKYPTIYRGLDVMVINKIDLLPYIDFNMDYFTKGLEILNPGIETFALSCKTGEGVPEWADWIKSRVETLKKQK